MLRSISRKLYTALSPSYDPFALHNEVAMEGYYAHFQSTSTTGDPCTIIIVFCEVKTAIDPSSRIMVLALYAPGHLDPASTSAAAKHPGGFKRELTASEWTVTRSSEREVGRVEEWKIEVQGIGSMEVGKDWQRWVVHMPPENGSDGEMMDLVVETKQRTPWTSVSEVAGPEGPLEILGRVLPIHWHVFSTASHAQWRLSTRPTSVLPSIDLTLDIGLPAQSLASGTAIAHLEKNHGVGFPTGWVWAHSMSPSQSATISQRSTPDNRQRPIRFAMAGGRILGLEAYLVGFRDDQRSLEWDFLPPWSVSFAGIALGLKTFRSWSRRLVRLDVWDWNRWLSAELVAEQDTFISIPGPQSKGFAPDLCHQSFQAHFDIKLYERPLCFSWRHPFSLLSRQEWAWSEVGRYAIEEGALEFGAEYVGERERGTKVHGE